MIIKIYNNYLRKYLLYIFIQIIIKFVIINNIIKKMKKIILTTISVFIISVSTVSLKAENYIYGGPKLFYYDVTQEDVDATAKELVTLGFASAKVEANTSGIGFDLGLGFPINDSWDVEGGFVYMGEFELKATMTGPAETLTATSSAWSIPVVGKYKIGDSDANLFIKAGGHYWKQNSDISTSLGKVSMWGSGVDPVIGVGGQLSNFLISYEHYSFSGVGAGAGIGDGGMSALSATWKKSF